MSDTSKKIKSIIKNTAPQSTFGTNPNDPWSAKAGISEADTESGMLHRYLNSRGINPKFVSKDTKISHSKSAEFAKWKNDHQFDDPRDTLNSVTADKIQKEETIFEETDKKDMICMDIPLLIRVLEFTREEMSSDIELHNMVERLINMRHDVPLDMTHYDDITKNLVKEEYATGVQGHLSQGTLDSIKNKRNVKVNLGTPSANPKPKILAKKPAKKSSFLSKLLHREESKLDESPKEGGKRKFSGMYNPAPKGTFAYDQAMRKKKHDEIEKNQSKDGSGMTSAIDRLEKHMNKEEVVTEMDKTQTPPGRDNDYSFSKGKWTEGKPVKPKTVVKDAKKILDKAFRKSSEKPVKEDYSRKAELSKSARMIKSLYKKHGMKEELYDHEKEDKSVATYGKKPKTMKTDVQNSFGDNSPQAAAVLTGGKTLTGQTRDTLEIDPMMRKPSRPDGKQTDK